MSALLPFTDLPEPEPPKWREHSGAKWITDHPQEWEFAKHLIREQLITSVLELARQIAVTFERWAHVCGARDGEKVVLKEGALGTLRNQITARIAAEFEPADIDRIDAMRARLLRSAAIAKSHELVDKANAKGDLGAVSMTMKLASDTAMQSSGAPSIVKEVRVVIDDLESIRARARQKTLALEAEVIEPLTLSTNQTVKEDA